MQDLYLSKILFPLQHFSLDCVEYLLLSHPSSVNVSNYEGRTGLHLAAASGNMEMVILLCTRNAIINPLMLYQVKSNRIIWHAVFIFP